MQWVALRDRARIQRVCNCYITDLELDITDLWGAADLGRRNNLRRLVSLTNRLIGTTQTSSVTRLFHSSWDVLSICALSIFLYYEAGNIIIHLYNYEYIFFSFSPILLYRESIAIENKFYVECSAKISENKGPLSRKQWFNKMSDCLHVVVVFVWF